MNVKELVKLLLTVDQNASLSLEGCDCEADPVGLSINGDYVIIRRNGGCYTLGMGENPEIITLKKD